MSIIRSPRPEANYTVVENSLINDKNLDWRELGILIYLLSKPDNWQVSITQLANEKSTGISGIKAAIKALKSTGYITTKRKSTGQVDWYVFDTPQVDFQPKEKPQVEKPQVEKPHVEIQPLIKTYIKTIPDLKTKTDDFIVSENLNVTAWNEFEQHRKSMKPALTNLARQKLITKIARLPSEKQQECIDLSIENGWKGLFPEKQSNGERNGSYSNKRVSAQPDNSATRHLERSKKAHAAAVARELGDRAVYEVPGDIQPQMAVGNRYR
jgi:DNA-binding transcriptional MocR family regulator